MQTLSRCVTSHPANTQGGFNPFRRTETNAVMFVTGMGVLPTCQYTARYTRFTPVVARFAYIYRRFNVGERRRSRALGRLLYKRIQTYANVLTFPVRHTILMSAYFWFLAGTLTGFAATLVVMPLWRGAAAALVHRRVRVAAASIGVAAFIGAAVLLYRTLGSPDLATPQSASATPTHPGMQAGQPAETMESAIAGLEARVARDGGKREDWLLLAQSYEFLGRTADAERARRSAEGAGTAAAATVAADTAKAAPLASPESATQYESRVRGNPRDVDAWRALAEIYRRQHAYEKARDAFAQLQKLNAMTADTWADQADVFASLAGGSLRGQAARSIDRALALDARHAKALWLKASLAHEEARYGDALAVWKQLRAVLPPDSPDITIIDANIDESRQLAGGSAAEASTPVRADSTASAEVIGTVGIDARLARRVPAGATLFIYAKAVDSPGPPLAVLRQVAGTWPVSFRLDDSLAMIPTRKLSQFQKVVVEARVSRSGQATPAAGDLYVTSAVLKPGDGKKLQLIINQEVG
jgi:cytochrome c-type biogenesis protein CcmH